MSSKLDDVLPPPPEARSEPPVVSANVTPDVTADHLTVASWNIHRAKGRDGRVDPARVAHAIGHRIAPHAPGILALQEADGDCPPHAGILDLAQISALIALRSCHDSPRLRWGPQSHGFLGTILFIRPDLAVVHADVIDLPGHCHRGAITAELASGIRVISTHLSLSQPLRIAQTRIIGQYLQRRPAMQTILLGDFNEWRPWGGLAFSEHILGEKFYGPAIRSFPTGRAILPLDRILTNVKHGIKRARAIVTPETELASDHRPVIADVMQARACL